MCLRVLRDALRRSRATARERARLWIEQSTVFETNILQVSPVNLPLTTLLTSLVIYLLLIIQARRLPSDDDIN